jgi:hypothetical protein
VVKAICYRPESRRFETVRYEGNQKLCNDNNKSQVKRMFIYTYLFIYLRISELCKEAVRNSDHKELDIKPEAVHTELSCLKTTVRTNSKPISSETGVSVNSSFRYLGDNVSVYHPISS